MKIGGNEVKGSCEEYLVLPRLDQPDIVFHAVAIMSMDEFDQMCPTPKPKPVLKAGGWEERYDDPDYMESLEKYAELRYAYILLKSLEPSGIEWDSVDAGKPSSWLNWRKDLVAAGFNSTEINRIVNCVSAANALDEDKLADARESFLRGLATASKESSGQNTDQQTTPYGTPANG